MKSKLPSRRDMKFYAKRWMLHPTCLRVTLLLVCMQIAFLGLRFLFGGTLNYALVNLANYGDTASGIYVTQEGISLIFRMDLTQLVLAIPMTYAQIAAFLGLSALFFLILAPLRLGAMEQYWRVLRGGQPVVYDVFPWYREGKRFGKAVVVEFVLNVFVRLVGVIAMVPSLMLFYIFYTTTPSMEAYTDLSAITQFAATILAVAAVVFAFWLHSLFLPVRYCLAAHPEYTLGETFRRGLASTKGYRGQFFQFRLSYIVWFFLSNLTYGALDFYVTPYTSMGGMVFVQEVARARQMEGEAQQQPPSL
ncbi:MAG: DUF975 family protein [Evtepia sp.]|uniref:DUF975 family protein n=1 Tax=Evtepia sp. TaxID=2773933 RepID=UPI002A74F1D6|nr:DUF975 family protein [Evtepia sp.]MDY3015004.1 DUF975 family protein [Evtepia sp.]